MTKSKAKEPKASKKPRANAKEIEKLVAEKKTLLAEHKKQHERITKLMQKTEMAVSEINSRLSMLCTDHQWVWSIMHRCVDKCELCDKTRLVENRPATYTVNEKPGVNQ